MDQSTKDKYIAAYRQAMPGWTDQQIEGLIEKQIEKRKTVLSGPDVIHLNYFGGIVDVFELAELKEMLLPAGIRLSSYDKSGDVHNHVQDFSLQISLMLKDPIVQTIVGGITVNVIWEAIKKSTLFIWHKVHNSRIKLNTMQAKLNFGLHIQVNENTMVDLKLDGDFTEQTVLAAMDKIPALIKEQGEQFKPEEINFLVYDLENGHWYKVDAIAHFRQLAEEQRLRRNSSGS